MIVAAILGKILSGKPKYPTGKHDLAMASRNSDAKKRRNDMMDTVMRNNEHSNKMSARSGGGGAARGPTVAEQVAARKAAKLAARKKAGQAQRKKYEAAMTQAKKMKLLFT